MKKTLSKIKNKSSKGQPPKNLEEERIHFRSNALDARGTDGNTDGNPITQQNENVYLYKISAESPRSRNRKENFQETEQSTTTYEPCTTSSESDVEGETSYVRKNETKLPASNDKKYKKVDPEVCITVPDGRRGNVRMVGNVNVGQPSKQVDFSSLDAVYGTTPEVSSDDGEEDLPYKKTRHNVYRVEDKKPRLFSTGPPKNGVLSSRTEVETDNNATPTLEQETNVQGKIVHDNNKGKDAESYVSRKKIHPVEDKKNSLQQSSLNAGLQSDMNKRPTLTLPLLSLNIQTSQEQASQKRSNETSGTPKLEENILHEFSSLSNNKQPIDLKHKSPVSSKIKHSNHKVNNQSTTPTHQLYYVDDKETDTTDLLGMFEQLIKCQNKENTTHEPYNNQNNTGNTSYNHHENLETGKQCNENVNARPVTSGNNNPLIYIATLDNKAFSVARNCSTDEPMNLNRENILVVESKSGGKYLSVVNKTSKESSKKNIDTLASKTAAKKAKKPSVSSSISKMSLRRKKSSILGRKIDKRSLGSTSGRSTKYVIREIMIIPEEETATEYANVGTSQSLNDDIPGENDMMTEKEVRLHDLNNVPGHGTDETLSTSSLETRNEASKINPKDITRTYSDKLQNSYKGVSIPCLYLSSTTDVADEDTDNSAVNNPVAASSTNQKPPRQHTSFTFRGNDMLQDYEVINKKYILKNEEESPINIDKFSTLVFPPNTHREIMKAIDAANGETSVISIPSKISRIESIGKRFLLETTTSTGMNSVQKQKSSIEPIKQEDEIRLYQINKDKFNDRYIRPPRIVSRSDIDITGNTETDRSELNIVSRNEFKTPDHCHLNQNSLSKRQSQRNRGGTILAYPSKVDTNTPMHYNNYSKLKDVKTTPNVNKERIKNSLKGKKVKTKEKSISLSFSEPLIQDETENVIISKAPGGSPTTTGKKRTSRGKAVLGKTTRKRKSESKSLPTPETVLYVGKLPDTNYNVFFTPDSIPNNVFNVKENNRTGVWHVESNTNKLSPVKSEKLLAEGPKAILIFVNKKTELNRNPFDGNVVYDDNGSGKRYKGVADDRRRHAKGDDDERRRHAKGDDDERRKRHKGGDSESRRRYKGDADDSRRRRKGDDDERKQGKGSKKKRSSDFDVASGINDPGSRSGNEGVIVERSPSGLKTVVTYPCGCIHITKFDPENQTASEELTSAFCRIGSQCEVSKSQNNQRLMKYKTISSDWESERPTVGSRGFPKFPQLDIVLEGIVSKKPIKPKPPATKMKGANLSGTLNIKTNRFNGVCNFYIDPRLKNYLYNNLACIVNKRDGSRYSQYS